MSLTDSGLAGRVVAGKVLDGLLKIQDDTKFAAASQKIVGAWSNTIELKLPETGISIDQISGACIAHSATICTSTGAGRRQRRHAQAVGARRRHPAEHLRRPRGRRRRSHAAGGGIHLRVCPARPVRGLSDRRRPLGRWPCRSSARCYRAFATKTARCSRNLWGEAFLTLNRAAEAENRFRFALRVDPHYWRAWRSLITALRLTRGDEAAYQSGVAMRKEADSLWFGPQADALRPDSFAQLTMDPGAVIAGLLTDRRLAQREGGRIQCQFLDRRTGSRAARLDSDEGISGRIVPE